MGLNAAEPSNQGGAGGRVVSSPDPLSSLQGVVDAAKEAVQIPKTPPTVTTQKQQFSAQFGSVQPSITEVPVAKLDPSINTVRDLLAKGPQTVEAVAPAEQTPAEKLKKQIEDSVNTFLEEVAKEKVAV